MILDGFIDLLYETDEGFIVVDYKTDAIVVSTLDEMVARYRPQGLAYALILSEQLERRVVRCEFVFLSAPGDALVGEVEVTEALLTSLRRAVGRVSS